MRLFTLSTLCVLVLSACSSRHTPCNIYKIQSGHITKMKCSDYPQLTELIRDLK